MKLKVLEIILTLVQKIFQYFEDKARKEERKQRQKEADKRDENPEKWYLDHFNADDSNGVFTSSNEDKTAGKTRETQTRDSSENN